MRTRTAVVITGALSVATPAAAQINNATPTTPTPVSVQVVEWDITPLGSLVPGALAVDDRSDSRRGKVWFVTRAGDTELYRFMPGTDMKHNHGSAVAWQLDAQLTGGLRLRHSDDGRFAFVDVAAPGGKATGQALVAIDTSDNSRVTWLDRPAADVTLSPSDVAVDTRDGGWNVFTAAPTYDASDFSAADGVVQRLRPGQKQLVNGTWVVPAVVTRYHVGGGAGTCDDGAVSPASPCIPGIAVDRRRGHPIYFSEPAFVNADGSAGAIGELDPTPVKCPFDSTATCAKVRHWPLPTGIGTPQQIRVDEMGRLWGATTSGSLFTLDIDPHCDQAVVSRHTPAFFDPSMFAVAPNGGLVGFTQPNDNNVSVLLPENTSQPVTPVIAYVQPLTKTIYGNRMSVTPVIYDVAPREGTATGVTYRNPGDGTYVHTDISSTVATSGSQGASASPTGMDGDGTWRSAAFYYGVAFNADGTTRIGHLAVTVDKHKGMDFRRSDNDRDHDGIDDQNDSDVDGDGIANSMDVDSDNDGVPDAIDTDKNGDGIEDAYQSAGTRDSQRQDTGTLAPGQTKEYQMEYDSHSLLMTAIFKATDVTAPLTMQIVDDSGNVVLNVPTVIGTAIGTAIPALPGVYTVRVTNAGLNPIAYTATVITRQALY